MKIKDEEGWNKAVDANQDPYGKCVIDFARDWADEMEKAMATGQTVAECAKRTCSEVDGRDGYGITGFMYGAAVSTLAHAWEHGEELRRWHNLDTQIKDEGARANESGGVLNPALLNIGSEGD